MASRGAARQVVMARTKGRGRDKQRREQLGAEEEPSSAEQKRAEEIRRAEQKRLEESGSAKSLTIGISAASPSSSALSARLDSPEKTPAVCDESVENVKSAPRNCRDSAQVAGVGVTAGQRAGAATARLAPPQIRLRIRRHPSARRAIM